jgi:hypothetical protein
VKLPVPKEILTQHVAVLGKTGSGKTSTAKLLVEQVVADGARVCILDPIKSDWWGLTSSADGKKAGLPFHILGGPRGHVPLHASAGKVIGEIVATGALPLSIIDMADFEPGGQSKFFKDFAPTLLRKMRGIVYLVIEEAHIFAPKERSGWGDENLSIHWAKTLATAGRSKGVRLVVLSQRTQALHNAVLGSCDTLIAHRLTAPADQEPVVKWLKANTTKEVLEQVASSLSSLKTGDAWLCSGEAKRFEVVHFPRIATYDNTATPTGDGDTREIKTAPVDQEKLRTLIGEEVEKAKADDPRELRKLNVEKDKRIRELEAVVAKGANTISAKTTEPKVGEKPALTEKDRQILATLADRLGELKTAMTTDVDRIVEAVRQKVAAAVNIASGDMITLLTRAEEQAQTMLTRLGVERALEKVAAVQSVRLPAPPLPPSGASRPVPSRPSLPAAAPRVPPSGGNGAASTGLPKAERAILTAAAQLHPRAASKAQLSVLSGYSITSSSFTNALGALRSADFLRGSGDDNRVTQTGLEQAGDVPPLPSGQDLVDYWRGQLPKAERTLLEVFARHGGFDLSKEDLSAESGYSATSSSFTNALGKLRTLELVRGLRLNDEVFS